MVLQTIVWFRPFLIWVERVLGMILQIIVWVGPILGMFGRFLGMFPGGRAWAVGRGGRASTRNESGISEPFGRLTTERGKARAPVWVSRARCS